MATIQDWQKYMNLLHELALVEDDLRHVVQVHHDLPRAQEIASRILFERFGVD